jgi:cytochrome b subunit of formate dehydrogenase
MSEKATRYLRFDVAQRFEHLVLIISFTLLGLTGLPQKYSVAPISVWVIKVLGGIEIIRIIHHIAAIVFILEAVYHLVVVGYKLYVLRKEASMVPGIKDGTDALQWFLHNIGVRKEAPKMPRYNFMEKVEYWAMLWGLILMGLTGLMLWNPLATVKLVPGVFIPAAKAAHGAEAVLAVLAILLWHFYNVHLKRLNWAMLKGTLSREEMEEEHGHELAKIEQGLTPKDPDPAVRRKRTLIYAPFATVFTLVGLFAVYQFVTVEETSITTLPVSERQVQIIEIQTPTAFPTAAPTPTEEPTAVASGGGASAATWDGGINKLFSKCSACHGVSGGLSVKTYADLMKGGVKGAAVMPGDPDASLVVIIMKGNHPIKFSETELQKVADWIKAGAPEK